MVSLQRFDRKMNGFSFNDEADVKRQNITILYSNHIFGWWFTLSSDTKKVLMAKMSVNMFFWCWNDKTQFVRQKKNRTILLTQAVHNWVAKIQKAQFSWIHSFFFVWFFLYPKIVLSIMGFWLPYRRHIQCHELSIVHCDWQWNTLIIYWIQLSIDWNWMDGGKVSTNKTSVSFKNLYSMAFKSTCTEQVFSLTKMTNEKNMWSRWSAWEKVHRLYQFECNLLYKK